MDYSIYKECRYNLIKIKNSYKKIKTKIDILNKREIIHLLKNIIFYKKNTKNCIISLSVQNKNNDKKVQSYLKIVDDYVDKKEYYIFNLLEEKKIEIVDFGMENNLNEINYNYDIF